jgi:hypothetical protein
MTVLASATLQTTRPVVSLRASGPPLLGSMLAFIDRGASRATGPTRPLADLTLWRHCLNHVRSATAQCSSDTSSGHPEPSPMQMSKGTLRFDYELELAIVIGR